MNDFIDSLNKESLDRLELIDKELYNIKSKSSLMDYLKKNCCLDDENGLDISLELMSKT